MVIGNGSMTTVVDCEWTSRLLTTNASLVLVGMHIDRGAAIPTSGSDSAGGGVHVTVVSDTQIVQFIDVVFERCYADQPSASPSPSPSDGGSYAGDDDPDPPLDGGAASAANVASAAQHSSSRVKPTRTDIVIGSGGAVAIVAITTPAAVVVHGCRFESNVAEGNGGGLFVYLDPGPTMRGLAPASSTFVVNITDTSFTGNSAASGAAIAVNTTAVAVDSKSRAVDDPEMSQNITVSVSVCVCSLA